MTREEMIAAIVEDAMNNITEDSNLSLARDGIEGYVETWLTSELLAEVIARGINDD